MNKLSISIQDLLVVCILTESIVQIVKTSFSIDKRQLSKTGINLFSILVAILLCCILDVSIFVGTYIDVLAGTFLAGLITSRGSNFVHNVVDSIMKLSNK